MAKGKEARHIIKLKSEASDHCYFTQKNKNNSKERIQLRKFDPSSASTSCTRKPASCDGRTGRATREGRHD